MLDRLIHLHWLIFAVTLGFASVVEWAHARRYLNAHDWPRSVCTITAAISSGFMASEALTHDWPSWEKEISLPKAVNWDSVLGEVQP